MEQLEPMPSRFEGFPGLMQGGYLAGVAAGPEPGPTRVQIHQPVRPGDRLGLEVLDGRRVLRSADGATVMVAFADRLEVEDPLPIAASVVAEATTRPLPWDKPFPRCAGCGDRADGLGVDLRVATDEHSKGRIVGRWTPAEVDHRHVWTVVDCLTSWSLFVDPPADASGTYVTGNIALEIRRPLRAGVPYRLQAWRDRDLMPPETRFRLGSVIVGGAISDDEGLVAIADQEMVRTDQPGMTLAPGGGPGPVTTA